MKYSDTKHLPKRSNYIDKRANELIEQAIQGRDEIYFMPISIEEKMWGNYKVYYFGILPDGSKTCIILKNIPIYFDVRLKEHKEEDILKYSKPGDIINKEIVYGLPPKIFTCKKEKYLRLYFNNLKCRKEIIFALRAAGYETMSDDCVGINYYFMKLAREQKFCTTGWNTIRNYKKCYPKETKCAYEFEIYYKNITAMSDEQIKKVEQKYVEAGTDKMCFIKDKTIVAAWDIETYTFGKEIGEVPRPGDNNFVIFCICCTFHYQYNDVPFLRVAICDVEAHSPSNADITVCAGTPEKVIRAFLRILGNMQPDILTGFNSGDFDTPLLKDRAIALIKNKSGARCGLYYFDKHLNMMHYGGYLKKYKKEDSKYKAALEKFQYGNGSGGINTWKFCNERIKIDAQRNISMTTMKFPGLIDIDVMIIFMGLYPRNELQKRHSLNYFLSVNGLESKEDMPYKKMFAIYARALKEDARDDMKDVLSYCITDALRCQQLLVKRTILADKREISNISYVTLYDAFYRANGKKVRNLMGAIYYDFGVMFSNITNDEGDHVTFPGAWVFPPIKGINKTRPVTGLDFSSLYPSLIMTYNLSPEKLVKNKDDMERLQNEGYDLYEISFNIDGLIYRGWTVRHKNNLIPGKSDERPGENMGLYGYILKHLFDKRAKLKKQLIKLSLLYEKLQLKNSKIYSSDLEGTEFEGRLEECVGDKFADDVLFFKNKIDSKQKALKVYMNTFYGETGNCLSPNYEIVIAGAITTSGRYNIQMVADYLEKNKYKIWYGDTDSVYASCPDYIFDDLDKDYYVAKKITKEEYWTKMVRITQGDFDKRRLAVNDLLIKDNGTTFLKMAYEEVLFPVVFTGKKKYFGFQHMQNINFNPPDSAIFVRGMEFIKQGKSPLSKIFGYEIMRECCNIDNNLSLVDIILLKIKKIYNNKWSVDKFVSVGKYKKTPSGKQGNVKINTFITRMKKIKQKYKNEHNNEMALLYDIPDYGDTFKYVVVKSTEMFDIRGCKIKYSVGDKMEFLSVYEASQKTSRPMEIDLNYYMDSSILKIFARFISYEERFQPPNQEEMTFKKIDEYSINKAMKFLMNYRDDLLGINKKEILELGRHYKRQYRELTKELNAIPAFAYGANEQLIIKNIMVYCFDIMDEILRSDCSYDIMARYYKTREDLFNVRVFFVHPKTGICGRRINYLFKKKEILEKDIKSNVNGIALLNNQYEEQRDKYIMSKRAGTTTDIIEFKGDSARQIERLDELIVQYISIIKLIRDNLERIGSIIDFHLKKRKSKI